MEGEACAGTESGGRSSHEAHWNGRQMEGVLSGQDRCAGQPEGGPICSLI